MTHFVAVVQGFPAHIRQGRGTPHEMRSAADQAENRGLNCIYAPCVAWALRQFLHVYPRVHMKCARALQKRKNDTERSRNELESEQTIQFRYTYDHWNPCWALRACCVCIPTATHAPTYVRTPAYVRTSACVRAPAYVRTWVRGSRRANTCQRTPPQAELTALPNTNVGSLRSMVLFPGPHSRGTIFMPHFRPLWDPFRCTPPKPDGDPGPNSSLAGCNGRGPRSLVKINFS
jgi:hypothetical protein